MQETERTKPTDELRQGDILRLEDGAGRGRIPALGVIINADCDLAHGKLDGVIAYLPMYAFRTYLGRFWAPSFVEEQRRSLIERIRTLCGLDDRGEEDLMRWLACAEVADVIARLSKACDLKGKDAAELADKLERLAICVRPSCEPLAAFASFCQREKNPQQFARKRISHAHSNMGDGHFFVSEIVGESEVGFVVRMRRIYTIDAACCFSSQAAQLASTSGDGLTAVRIARFAPPFRFKLAQLFAYQFSRIGLPDEAAALSSLAIEDMVMQLSGASA